MDLPISPGHQELIELLSAMQNEKLFPSLSLFGDSFGGLWKDHYGLDDDWQRVPTSQLYLQVYSCCRWLGDFGNR
jgi:hypothetical protein